MGAAEWEVIVQTGRQNSYGVQLFQINAQISHFLKMFLFFCSWRQQTAELQHQQVWISERLKENCKNNSRLQKIQRWQWLFKVLHKITTKAFVPHWHYKTHWSTIGSCRKNHETISRLFSSHDGKTVFHVFRDAFVTRLPRKKKILKVIYRWNPYGGAFVLLFLTN